MAEYWLWQEPDWLQYNYFFSISQMGLCPSWKSQVGSKSSVLNHSLTRIVMSDSCQGEQDLFICECAVIIRANGTARMLCGLRGGTVVMMDIQWQQGKFAL